ncbi:MAG: hypothetical protein PVI67_06755 [Anaerolineae bacterium]|jgi:hypothetical protein
MAKYLIEVPHEAEKAACLRAIQTFLETGSHFLANADWGCMDGDHRAWLTMEAENRDDVMYALPPSVRPDARIVRLEKFTMADVEKMASQHQG